MVDIHSHILPEMDDGSESIEESLALLKMMSEQGITDVFATSHFYPQTDNALTFKRCYDKAFSQLTEAAANEPSLPKIHRGCEMLYFKGIGKSDSIKQFCYDGSDLLLLETVDGHTGDDFKNDVLSLKLRFGINVIIAHMERYCDSHHFSELVRFCKKYEIPVQVNASSFTSKYYKDALDELIEADVVKFVGTDTHSLDGRPPKMAEAFDIIEKNYGSEYAEQLKLNSENFLKRILSGE